MPKISAPTVAEHRANRRAALLRAGEAVLSEEGLAQVIPRRVCERAGLARSSFYDYFDTRDDLLVAIAIDAFERWNDEIEEHLATAPTGLPSLRAFVDATMAMAGDGKHDVAKALQDADLAPSRMDDLMRLHDTLMHPVLAVLTELGVPKPQTTAGFVQGVLSVGVTLVSHGADHREVADDVFEFVTRGLGVDG